jgi:hypothetical protein
MDPHEQSITSSHPLAGDQLDAITVNTPQQIGLLKLPIELFIQICTFLCAHCCSCAQDLSELVRQQALSRLSRTCKLMRAVARPILYHSITIIDDSGLFSVVRTLVEQPDLRPLVFELSVTKPSQRSLGVPKTNHPGLAKNALRLHKKLQQGD